MLLEKIIIPFLYKNGIPSGQRIGGILKLIFNVKYFISSTNYGFKMYLNIEDLIQRAIFYDKVWEKKLSEYLNLNITPSDIIFDIGANVGYFTLLSHTKEPAKIYSFEPDKKKCDLLNLNLKLNKISNNNILVLPIGLNDKVEKLEYFESHVANSGISGFNKIPSINSYFINVTTIDYLIENKIVEYPTIVKIDTEGWEYKILLGGMNSFKKRPPRLIIFECNNDLNMFDAISQMIYNFGNYHITELFDDHGTNYIAKLNA